ncbi:MAG: hypothetical protein L0099_13830, partial [Acidobacteria bacterium]|nr:hypothetical protein [Acidobacteriota bacterium]
MSFPAASDESGRLGIGALPEELKQGFCEHVASCARCQALLEQLSDDPALRRRAPAVWPAASPVPSEAALAGVLEQLHAVSPLDCAVAWS